MFYRKQIDVVNLTNTLASKRLLGKYGSSSVLDREDYEPAMKGEEMQVKFGKYIEMATHTWTHKIFDQYLNTLPRLIGGSEAKINEYEQQQEHSICGTGNILDREYYGHKHYESP